MKKPTHPPEKKRLAYEKDHVAPAEYPHMFRRAWPRKKARLQRYERRAVRQRLAELAPRHGEPLRDDMPLRPVRRPLARKWGAVALGEWIRMRQSHRAYRAGWKFFKQPYASDQHREPFMAFLESVISGRRGDSAALAQGLQSILDADAPEDGQWDAPKRKAWLRAFLRDEPEWEGRRRAWIASFESDQA